MEATKKLTYIGAYPLQIFNLRFNSLNPYHWAGLAILNNGMAPSNEYIREFISDAEGTYALIDVAIGQFVGSYVISIQTTG